MNTKYSFNLGKELEAKVGEILAQKFSLIPRTSIVD
jgi:hypothetical protein